MRRIRSDLTDAELEVLKALWRHGAPASIRDLTDAVYPSGGAAHYSTVQKLLERLKAKGGVRRRRRGRLNLYEAQADRGAVIEHRLRGIAESLGEGSLTPLLTHLVGSAELSPTELSALRDLVDGRRKRKGRA